MGIKIIVLNASGNLSSCESLLKESIRGTLKKVKKKIPVKNVDIVVKETDYPENLKDMDGVSGYCYPGHFIQISVDPKNPKFKRNIRALIERTLSHELHHAMRQQSGVDFSKETFLECMFSEGLANYFSYEVTGKIPIWAKALNEEDKNRLRKRIKTKLNKEIEDEEYADWFTVGSNKKNIPRWTGYTLGFDIVKKYIENHPGESSASLVDLRISELIYKDIIINL